MLLVPLREPLDCLLSQHMSDGFHILSLEAEPQCQFTHSLLQKAPIQDTCHLWVALESGYSVHPGVVVAQLGVLPSESIRQQVHQKDLPRSLLQPVLPHELLVEV